MRLGDQQLQNQLCRLEDPVFVGPKVKLILFSAFERSLQKFRFHARRFVCKTSFSECSVFFFSSFAALGENTKSLGERKHLIFTFPSFVQRFFSCVRSPFWFELCIITRLGGKISRLSCASNRWCRWSVLSQDMTKSSPDGDNLSEFALSQLLGHG